MLNVLHRAYHFLFTVNFDVKYDMKGYLTFTTRYFRSVYLLLIIKY